MTQKLNKGFNHWPELTNYVQSIVSANLQGKVRLNLVQKTILQECLHNQTQKATSWEQPQSHHKNPLQKLQCNSCQIRKVENRRITVGHYAGYDAGNTLRRICYRSFYRRNELAKVLEYKRYCTSSC